MTNKKNAGIGGGLILLKPKLGELQNIIDDVTKGKMWNYVNKIFVWPEQQYLTYRYSGQWTGINPRFFGLQGYPHWKVLFGLQYGGDKPFILTSKFSMEVRIQYPDYILWHDLFREILNNHEYLKTAAFLQEAIKMNSYFKFSKLSRIITFPDKIENISKILKINKKYIHKNQIEYYFLDVTKDYIPINIKPLFKNINEYNYFEPISQLKEYFKNSESDYYKNILKSINGNKNNIDRKLLSEFNLDNETKDIIIYNYIQCRPLIFILTVWPFAVKYIDKLLEFLNVNGNVYYKKIIELKYEGVKNLMDIMYDDFTKQARYDFILKKLNYIGTMKNNNNKIGIIVFDNVKNKNLGGQNSEFKRQIRNLLLSLIKNDSINNNELRGNDIIHINDYFYQSIIYSQYLFNKNSIEMLNKRKLERVNTSYWNKSNIIMNTFKKWNYQNLNLLEISRLCLLGGSIYSAYGIRPSNDIDAIIINTNNNSPEEKEFQNKIYENFVKDSTKFKFADIGIENTKYWKESWTLKNKEFINIIKIKSFSEIVLNPKYYFYFNGFKHYLIDFEIVKKFLRYRPEDYADFIIMYLKFKDIIENRLILDENMKLKLPEYSKNNKLKKYSNDPYKDTFEIIKKKYLPQDYSDININIIKNFLP